MGTWNSEDHKGSRLSPTQFIMEARILVASRIKYRHQGRNLNGLDCLGLIVYILTKHELLPNDFSRTNYGRLPMAELAEKAALLCERIEKPVDGCMVLIRWPGEKRPAHAAIYAYDNLIHCYAIMGRVVEHGYRGKWPQWADSFWKLPGIDYE